MTKDEAIQDGLTWFKNGQKSARERYDFKARLYENTAKEHGLVRAIEFYGGEIAKTYSYMVMIDDSIVKLTVQVKRSGNPFVSILDWVKEEMIKFVAATNDRTIVRPHEQAILDCRRHGIANALESIRVMAFNSMQKFEDAE